MSYFSPTIIEKFLHSKLGQEWKTVKKEYLEKFKSIDFRIMVENQIRDIVEENTIWKNGKPYISIFPYCRCISTFYVDKEGILCYSG